jgi:hypothetical protein
MTRSMTLTAWLCLLMLGSQHAAAAGGEFRFTKPVPIRSILETFEAVGQFNIILCAGVEGTATFSITDVSPKEALRIFVMSQGLKIHPVENSGGRETFLVGSESQITAVTQNRGMQVVTLRFQDANRLEEILKDVLASNQVKIRSVSAQNMLILEGPSSGLRKAVEILTYLDLPVPTVSFTVSVTQGTTEIWQARLETRSGHPVEAIVGSSPEGDKRQQYLTLKLLPRVNKDGFIYCDADVKMSTPEATKEPQLVGVDRVSTSAQIKSGEPATIASFKRADGSSLDVKVAAQVGQVAVMPSLDPNEILSNFPKLPEIDIEEDVAADAGGSPQPSPAPAEIDELGSVDITSPTTGMSDPGPLLPPASPPDIEIPGVPGEDLLESPFEEDEYPRVLPPDEE